jgi:hypothetical protein
MRATGKRATSRRRWVGGGSGGDSSGEARLVDVGVEKLGCLEPQVSEPGSVWKNARPGDGDCR